MSVQEGYSPREFLGRPLNDVERKNAPERLFAAGQLEIASSGPQVSVVGSRDASPEALDQARGFAAALVERGIVVVSGLAAGIDAVAHDTALAHGGRTIAVLGTPLDQFYPKQNRALQERLMREQLVVSQFAPGTPIGRKNFPMRNRTMALLTDATVIVEAGEKSGTLHQGWEAIRLGRLLFLMERVTKNKALAWPDQMIRYGAQILSSENLELVLEEMPELPRDEPASL